MNHNLLKITYLFISLPLLLQGQSLEGTWKQLPLTSELSTRMNADLVLPSDAKAYLVDVSVINNLLMNARSSEQIQMALPLGPEGEEEIFNMTYDPIMGIMDQKKFSDILTFRAVSTDGKGKLGRIGISSLGFYGILNLRMVRPLSATVMERRKIKSLSMIWIERWHWWIHSCWVFVVLKVP